MSVNFKLPVGICYLHKGSEQNRYLNAVYSHLIGVEECRIINLINLQMRLLV